MKFTVTVQPIAQGFIDDQVCYIAVENAEPQNAAAWLARVNDAIASLEFMPTRCSVAPENSYTTETIYMLPVDSHLLLFSVDEDVRMVKIVGFRRGSQLPVKGLG